MSVSVCVALPSAFFVVTTVWFWSNLESEVLRVCRVTVRPSAEVVTIVCACGVPSALRSVIVSVRLPSRLSTVTSVAVWSNLPAPVLSHCVVVLRPLALTVFTWRLSSVLSALKVLTVSVRLPSALRTVTSVWV
ncbi:hypothetical protein [Bradyrhizobium sp.]|uniref:hypothetical protein n=1 Tax=Bradyrhizobium sp. TaxID=376 RepID=UPI0029013CBD|nr:hypothetical protein [Bradyrhizobium sp.]MDU2922348.1 hypothetical protein [Bradyrhizobium sp.]